MTLAAPATFHSKSLPAARGRALIDDWLRSGLSKIAYSRQHDIGVHRISYWLKRLKAFPSPPGSGDIRDVATDFIQLPTPTRDSAVAPLCSDSSPVEILFPRGIALRVRSGVDVSLLRTVLSALDHVPC